MTAMISFCCIAVPGGRIYLSQTMDFRAWVQKRVNRELLTSGWRHCLSKSKIFMECHRRENIAEVELIIVSHSLNIDE
jgi:hypothetical protein